MKGVPVLSFCAVGDTSLCVPDLSSSLEQQWHMYPTAKVTSFLLETHLGFKSTRRTRPWSPLGTITLPISSNYSNTNFHHERIYKR
jgi:hypothetical protein